MTDIENSPKFLDYFQKQEDDQHPNDTLFWIFAFLLVCVLFPPMIFVFLLAAVAGILVTLFPPKK